MDENIKRINIIKDDDQSFIKISELNDLFNVAKTT